MKTYAAICSGSRKALLRLPSDTTVFLAQDHWASVQSGNAFVRDTDLTIRFAQAQGSQAFTLAHCAQGGAGFGLIDDAMHGAAQQFPLMVENSVAFTVQSSRHVNALIEIGVEPAFEAYDDGGMGLV